MSRTVTKTGDTVNKLQPDPQGSQTTEKGKPTRSSNSEGQMLSQGSICNPAWRPVQGEGQGQLPKEGDAEFAD